MNMTMKITMLAGLVSLVGVAAGCVVGDTDDVYDEIDEAYSDGDDYLCCLAGDARTGCKYMDVSSNSSAVSKCQDRVNNAAADHCEDHPNEEYFFIQYAVYNYSKAHQPFVVDGTDWKCVDGSAEYY